MVKRMVRFAQEVYEGVSRECGRGVWNEIRSKYVNQKVGQAQDTERIYICYEKRARTLL